MLDDLVAKIKGGFVSIGRGALSIADGISDVFYGSKDLLTNVKNSIGTKKSSKKDVDNNVEDGTFDDA